MRYAKAIAGLGCHGDGIKMVQEFGANLLDTPYVKATYGFAMNASTINDSAFAFYSGGIIINKQGRRIVDESLSYKLLGDVVLMQEGAYAYQIYDESMRQNALTKGLGSGSPELLESKGIILKANSIKELAMMAELDPEVVEKTVNDYNSYVEAKTDPEFGRKHLSGSYGDLVKIETGPFYCLQSTAVLLATYCGVKVAPDCQVLNVYDEPILGLYATGEMIGGFHGAAYMSGTSFCKTQVLGRAPSVTLVV